MAVLKSNLASPDLAPFSMRDVERQAQTLLLCARRTAETLIVEAQKEAEVLKKQSTAAGLAEGRQQGLAQGLEEGRQSGHQTALAESKQELSQVFSALSSLMNQFESGRLELESAGLTEVVQLAAAVARRVTKRQAQLDPAVLSENLKEAMKLTVQQADIRILINPAQRVTLTEQLPLLQLHWPSLKHVELIEDAAIEPGGCRLLTRSGEIDARIDVQLERVINDLLPAPAPV